MRLRPKSKARDGFRCGHALKRARLRMTGFGAEALHVDPQQPPRARPALLVRQLETPRAGPPARKAQALSFISRSSCPDSQPA